MITEDTLLAQTLSLPPVSIALPLCNAHSAGLCCWGALLLLECSKVFFPILILSCIVNCPLEPQQRELPLAWLFPPFASETMWRAVLSQQLSSATWASTSKTPCKSAGFSLQLRTRFPSSLTQLHPSLCRQSVAWKSGSFTVSKLDYQWTNRKNELHNWKCVSKD